MLRQPKMDADRVPLLLAFEASEVRRTSSGEPADPSDLLLLEDDDEADIVASPLHPDFNLDNLAAQRTNWAWTRAGLAFIGMSLTVMSDSLTKTSAFYALFFLLVGLVLSLIAAARFLVTFRDLETGKFRVLNRLILATSVVTFIGHLVILLMMAILP